MIFRIFCSPLPEYEKFSCLSVILLCIYLETEIVKKGIWGFLWLFSFFQVFRSLSTGFIALHVDSYGWKRYEFKGGVFSEGLTDFFIFLFFIWKEKPVTLVVNKSMIVLCEYEIAAFLKDICQFFIVILCNL